MFRGSVFFGLKAIIITKKKGGSFHFEAVPLIREKMKSTNRLSKIKLYVHWKARDFNCSYVCKDNENPIKF